MKKSLILIAIALMVLVPVFAENTGSSDTAGDTSTVVVRKMPTGEENTTTKVETTIGLQPEYYYGVTDAELSSKDDTITNMGTIKLTRNTNSNTLSTANEYVSYKFVENEAVTLYIKISGDMQPWNTSTNEKDTTRSTTIPLTITVAETEDKYSTVGDDGKYGTDGKITSTTLVTINSTTEGETEKAIVSYNEKTKVGDISWCSAGLTIAPQKSLDGVQLGYYLATITLTAKSK